METYCEHCRNLITHASNFCFMYVDGYLLIFHMSLQIFQSLAISSHDDIFQEIKLHFLRVIMDSKLFSSQATPVDC